MVANNLSTLEDIANNKTKFETIPRQTVYNWIKEWQVPKVSYPPIEFNGNTLYIMGDEKWIHEQLFNDESENKSQEKENKKKKALLCQNVLLALPELLKTEKEEVWIIDLFS